MDGNNAIKTETGIEVYENDIVLYLDQYIQDREIKDMAKEPQSKWNACLSYINKHVFKHNRERLLYPDNRDTYNSELINDICDVYIDLCFEYDKEVSIIGFSRLTGIDTDTLHSWGNKEYRSSSSSPDIYKKLVANNEESLSNMLISGSRNPMKVLPALNRRHNWNMGQPRGVDGTIIHRTPEEIEAKVLEDIPIDDEITE